MGFGSTFKKLTSGGALKGALAGGLLVGGFPAIFGGALLGGELLGGGESDAVKAMRAAGASEAAIAAQIRRETAPFRERADIAGQELLSLAQAPLGESEEFKRDVQEGLTQQRLALGAFGLGDSTTFGTAAGRTTADVLSAERGRRVNILQFLAGGAETGLPLSSQAGLISAQSTANVGALRTQREQQRLQTGVDLLGTGATIASLA
jgi:hypothetical protein